MLQQRKLKNAISWSALDVFAKGGMNFLVYIILARLLSPTDFGLMAMLTVFVVVADVFVYSGFSQALIQRQDASIADESTVFFFNLIMGIIVALALFEISPLVATFYKQPILEFILPWLALNLLINSLGSIHTTLLTKEMNFKVLAITGFCASITSGLIAIILAVNGFGVWSLVWSTLCSSVMLVILLWLLHPWKPIYVFNFSTLQSYFGFGGFLVISSLLSNVYNNLYASVIGKTYSAKDVGFYTRAQSLQLMPVSMLTSIVGRIAFPLFSQFSDDKLKLAKGMKKMQTMVMLLNMPLMTLMFMLAEPLVLVLLGNQWVAVIPLIKIFSISGILWPINALNINILKAQGYSKLNAKLLCLKLAIGISLLLLALPHGINAIAITQIFYALLAFFINSFFTRFFLDYGPMKQLRDLLPYLLMSIPMAFSIWLLLLADIKPYQTLIAGTMTGVGTYVAMCYLFKIEAVNDFFKLMMRKDK